MTCKDYRGITVTCFAWAMTVALRCYLQIPLQLPCTSWNSNVMTASLSVKG